MEYRWSVFFSTISSVFSIWIMIMLWKYLYHNDVNMITYMNRYIVVANIIAIFYCRGIAKRIGDRVSNGMFALDLLKPINIFTMSWLLELGEVLASFIIKGLPIIILYFNTMFWKISFHNAFFCMLALIIGHIIFVLMYSILGFLAIVLFDIWPFQRLLDDTIRFIGGGIIPLTIMPEQLRSIATLLPFQYLYSFPLQIMFNKIETQIMLKYFFVGFLWLIVLILLNLFVYRSVMKKVVIQGG
ncbi:ABC transporter permease [Paenibacillus zanthoxyli]|uniref:ABC transporter permease n=1 Tax=Paenibacillus zanthoxyli TaxID=369399 RepID=UPI0005669388